MVMPLQDKLEDWRKNVSQLDKDHAKEYKKLRQEIKKKSDSSARVQKKNKKNKNNPEAQKLIEMAQGEVTKHYRLLVDTEKSAVRKALVEER